MNSAACARELLLVLRQNALRSLGTDNVYSSWYVYEYFRRFGAPLEVAG